MLCVRKVRQINYYKELTIGGGLHGLGRGWNKSSHCMPFYTGLISEANEFIASSEIMM